MSAAPAANGHGPWYRRPVTYAWLIIAYVGVMIALILCGFALQEVTKTSEHADLATAKSRLGQVRASCEQINENSVALATLIHAVYAGIDSPEAKARFRQVYFHLQPNDCYEQTLLLQRKLVKEKDFDATVAYSPDPLRNGVPQALRLPPLPED